jgi:hypothetical protein
MSNVEQLADHQKKRDELIAHYLIFLNSKCNEWLDQKSYENFHNDEVIGMFIIIRKQMTKYIELKQAYINLTMRLKYDNFVEFERLFKEIEDGEYQHLTLDNIQPGQWFHEKHNNYMDIAHAIRQLPSCSLKVDWWDEKCHFALGDFNSSNIDDILVILSEKIHDNFSILSSDKNLERAVRMLLLRNENGSNTRLNFLDNFLQYYDSTFQCVEEVIKKIGCPLDEYHKEAVRSFLIGATERSYRPGCYLGRIITLYGPRDVGKSALCKLIGGDTDLSNPKYHTDETILLENNLVTRYSYTNGKAICEDAERAGHSKQDLERLKKEATKIADSRRPLFKNDSRERPRWYDIGTTTNEDEYSLEANDVRDWGIGIGKLIDIPGLIKIHSKVMAWSVYNVKDGMSGAIKRDPIVLLAANQKQDDHVPKSDLVDFLEGIFTLTHLVPGIQTREKIERLWRRYQISVTATEIDNGDGSTTITSYTYMIGKLDAVTQFATDYKNHFERRDVKVDKKLVKLAIPKIRIKLRSQDGIEKEFKWVKMDNEQTMRAPLLYTSIYGHYFTIDGAYLKAVYDYAMQYLEDNQGFIGGVIKQMEKNR